MATKLGTIIADFETSLATAIAVAGTTASLQSATDSDSVALPAGRYFFTVDKGNSSKEHISCDLSGTSLTNIKSVSRQGAETVGVARAHRVGAKVSLTDFAHIKYINDLVSGTTTFNAAVPLGYDGTATITTNNQLATKAYADGLSFSGTSDATTTQKGIVEVATQAEVDARTVAGATSANLSVNPLNLRSVLTHDYAADAGSNDTYVITVTPAPTAYTTGAVFRFKANTVNTGTATLNVNSLGAKTIKKNYTQDLADGDIAAGQIVSVIYDGTNLQLLSPISKLSFSRRQAFTVSGTFTVPAGVYRIHVRSVGAGGGGGGSTSSTGSGGGGGGYADGFYDVTPAATYTVTIGAAGSGGANGNGTAGGNTTFGALQTANGGAGGFTDGGLGGNGGTATGGDFNITGQKGTRSSVGGFSGGSLSRGGDGSAAGEGPGATSQGYPGLVGLAIVDY